MHQVDKFPIRTNTIIGGAIFAVTLAVYVSTMCPTIFWEDSAAFSAVNSILGIPHSPGFPIYVLLGRVFSILSIENPAFRSNLMSAFWGSLSLVILYLLMLEFFNEKKIYGDDLHWRFSSREKKRISQLGMVTGILFLGFSSAFWLQTIRAEVYTLNIFLMLSLILLLIRWFGSKDVKSRFRILILFSLVLGLSLANHPLLIITLVPAFLIFSLFNDFKYFLNLKRLMVLSSFILLGISVYLFLLIRSNLSPAINWGRPDSLTNLFSYITRSSQPTPLAINSSVPYLNRFWFSFSFPVTQFSLAFFWLGVLGAYAMFKESKRVFIFTFLVFIFNLSTAAWATDFSLRNYDLLGYLLPSLSVFALWFALGMSLLLGILLKTARRFFFSSRYPQSQKGFPYIFKFLIYGLVLLLPLFQIHRNLNQCNKNSNNWAYHYADQILNSVKKDALILVEDDNTLTTLWYLNHAEKIRPDVKIVSNSALGQKSYRDQLQEQYKYVNLPKIELENSQNIAYDLCRLNIDKMPVYYQYYTNDTAFTRHLSPAGYLFEYHPEQVALSDSNIKMQKQFLEANLKNKGFDLITKEHFGNLLFNIGAFYNHLGISTTSLEYFLWALDTDPSNSRIYAQLGKAFLKTGEKNRAKEFFRAALEINPYDQNIRRTLEDI